MTDDSTTNRSTTPAMTAERDANAALQEQLQDLRSLAVHADHLRWVTRGAGAPQLADLLTCLSSEWHDWIEEVARVLVERDQPPDGRIASLTDGRGRGWLPGEWMDVESAKEWISKELAKLESWAHLRGEEIGDSEIAELCTSIGDGLYQEHANFERWRARRSSTNGHVDEELIDEAGLESFPASDPPPFWAGPD